MKTIKKEVPFQFDSQQIPMFHHLLNQCSVLDNPSPPLGHPIVSLSKGKVLDSSYEI